MVLTDGLRAVFIREKDGEAAPLAKRNVMDRERLKLRQTTLHRGLAGNALNQNNRQFTKQYVSGEKINFKKNATHTA